MKVMNLTQNQAQEQENLVRKMKAITFTKKLAGLPNFMMSLAEFKSTSIDRSESEFFDSPKVSKRMSTKYSSYARTRVDAVYTSCEANLDGYFKSIPKQRNTLVKRNPPTINTKLSISSTNGLEKVDTPKTTFTSATMLPYSNKTKSINDITVRSIKIKISEVDDCPFEMADSDVETSSESVHTNLSNKARDLFRKSKPVRV